MHAPGTECPLYTDQEYSTPELWSELAVHAVQGIWLSQFFNNELSKQT